MHIDDRAIAAVGEFFRSALPANGVVLDLMSSWRSHMPADFVNKKLVGLGMNDVEMSENPDLDEWVVHDLNANPTLPFESESFEAAFVVVSIQYMTSPVEVFTEVNRLLKDGAGFHVIYSNRMFPTKAVAIWRSLDEKQKAGLIGSYFINSGRWDAPQVEDISPQVDGYTDPVYVVSAVKSSSEPDNP